MSAEPAFVHPTAIVDSDVVIGSGTKVWHHTHLRTGARIGEGCVLGKNVFVDAGVSIGNAVRVQNNVSIYAGVTLEDAVFVGPSAVFTNDLRPRAGDHDWQVIPTHVQSGASIGANATIVCGVTLGSWCMVAAGSVVTRSVRDHELVVGNPARHRGWVCRCGERLPLRVGAELDSPVTCEFCGSVTTP